MTDKKTEECVAYDSEKVALTIPLPKEYYLKRIISVILAVAVFVILVIACTAGVEWLRGAVNGGGGRGEMQGGAVIGDSESESNDMENDPPINTPEDIIPDSEDAENNENGEESEPADNVQETEKAPEKENGEASVEIDVSLAERGDAYIINYSSLSPDTVGILEMGFSGGRYSYTEEPIVLIIHTHTSEGYADMDASVPTHILSRGVVALGESVAQGLTSKGVPAVHCTVIHDGGNESPYRSAAETIRMMLEIYPSIEYVIDLHRLDDVDGEGRIIKTMSANGSAQIQITVSSGGVRIRDSLALALTMRRKLNSDGKRICMPTVLTDSEYNAGLVPYYLKVDIGSLGNLSSEAMAAGEFFVEALADILKK